MLAHEVRQNPINARKGITTLCGSARLRFPRYGQNPINARKGITTLLVALQVNLGPEVRILLMPVRALRQNVYLWVSLKFTEVRILLMPVRALRPI